jgi:hypothetical protein
MDASKEGFIIMALKNTAESIIFTIFFALCLLMFVTLFLGKMNPNSQAVIDDKYGLNSSSVILQGQIDDFKNFSDKLQYDTAHATAEPILYVFLIFKAAFDIPLAFIGMIGGGVAALYNMLQTSLGGGWAGAIGVGLTLLFAIMLIRLVLNIVSAIRTGQT